MVFSRDIQVKGWTSDTILESGQKRKQVSLPYRHSRSFKFRFITLGEVAMVTF